MRALGPHARSASHRTAINMKRQAAAAGQPAAGAVVAHIDMDCFYCAVEKEIDPSLKGRPFVVVQFDSSGLVPLPGPPIQWGCAPGAQPAVSVNPKWTSQPGLLLYPATGLVCSPTLAVPAFSRAPARWSRLAVAHLAI